jgi:phage terminase large subunit-like protein
MWGTMREWLRTAAIGSLEDNAAKEDKEIRADLIGPRYSISSNGSVQLESKKEMKKRGVASPDEADALALSLAYPLGDNILIGDKIRLWSQEVPSFQYVVQSYSGAYTEKTADKTTAGSVWGVFEHKDKKCVMLLDCWSEKMSYGALRTKIIKDWHALYGPKTDNNRMARQRKPDVALVGDGVSDAQIADLRDANVIVPTYKRGEEDDVERAHKAAAIIEEGAVYIPESSVKKGQVTTWAKELTDQMDRFPNDQIDLVSTMTRALLYVRDSGLLVMPEADLDEADYEKDYTVTRSGRVDNPYSV